MGDTAPAVGLAPLEPPVAVAVVDDVGSVPEGALVDVAEPAAVGGDVEVPLAGAPGLAVTDGDIVTTGDVDTEGAGVDIGAGVDDVADDGGIVTGTAAVVVMTGASGVTIGAAAVVVITGASGMTIGAATVVGAGATVVGPTVVVTGSAIAGTTPPVTAVSEIAAPEARTTATPRRLRTRRAWRAVGRASPRCAREPVAASFMICPPLRWP